MSLLLLTLSICFSSLVSPIVSYNYRGDLGAHDPSLIKAGNCYYIFSSEDHSADAEAFHNGNIPIRRICDNNVERITALFDDKPGWFEDFTVPNPGMWAPDVNFHNDQYYVYYAGSSTGSRNSAIGLATARNIEGPFTDQGEVLHTSDDLDYNAIDPHIGFTIEDGQKTQMWLIFGSFWSGIKARRLDMNSGKLSNEDTRLYSLASRNGAGDNAIEGASSAYRNGWYYLFVSWDHCCAGSDSNYRVMVGRSRQITGPYVDRNGNDMLLNGGTEILATHDNVHGPGGEDILEEDGVYRMIHHWYDSNEGGAVKFDVQDLRWEDDWPVVGGESQLNYN